MTFPTQAQIVIIGGGIIGCSTAYHLAEFGARDVLLLERKKLTSGSTFHAAGLVGQLRTSANITRLLTRSIEIYRGLEGKTGQATGWKMNGGLRLACNAQRMTEIKRQATTARSFGLEMHLLSPKEAHELWPLMDISDVLGAAYLPTDGQANPSDITLSLAKGARQKGARIIEDVAVTDVVLKDGRAQAVMTAQGLIACETIVICAGQWSKEIGRKAGITIPLQSVEHQYLITEPCGAPRNLPTLRDPDRLIYYKEEVGGLVMGGYEPNPIAWALDGIPEGFHFTLLESRFDHFEPIMEQALARTPVLATAGVKSLINGPESFTPDGNFILGEAPEARNVFVGCGFNAFGIASGGGAGWALAQWVLAGEPPMDLWPVDIRRFSPSVHGDEGFVRERTLEAYAKHYTMAWPHEEYESARRRKTSRLYATLAAKGACFGSKLGWERPNWFARAGLEPKDIYGYGRQNWFDAVGDEHHAVRERVGLFDQSSFAKFEVRGKGAEAALDQLCAGDVTRPPGRTIYTQMLNTRGGIECDLTVSRFAPERYFVVTGTGFRTHDLAWIRRNLPPGAEVEIADVTEGYGCLSLMGPGAREVLGAVSDADVSNEAFSFATCREIEIGGVSLRALRITYVGELGFELHVPADSIERLYAALMEAGEAHGIANAGYRAIESLRLEKAYRAWGADIGADTTPDEAGLGFAVRKDMGRPFLGREALLAKRKAPLSRKLAIFTVDDPRIVLLGRETIIRNGEAVGWLTSGGWGYTVATNIGLGYVRWAKGVTDEFLRAGEYRLDVAGEEVPARFHPLPLYDPTGSRPRA
ncbi:MAG: FAD-dependent oxidoreductase [Hyphomicrobiales bacterium]|nr:FAD-dependent oxidoreductase [Hyphomicrobiales bacterium]